MLNLNEFLKLAIEKNASDLHLISKYSPSLRIEGKIYFLNNFPPFEEKDLEEALFSLLNDEQKQILLTNKELDLSQEFEETRFRINLYYTKNGLSASFRLIPKKIRTLEELNLPPSLYKICDLTQGFVLVTGPTSNGKSTTLAALINEINLKYPYHVITIEDPIEYVYPKGLSIISQRELYTHTYSWNKPLKSALREDPNVILD
jgi:twitching motility protein PilT